MKAKLFFSLYLCAIMGCAGLVSCEKSFDDDLGVNNRESRREMEISDLSYIF